MRDPLLIIKTGTPPAPVIARRGLFEQWIVQRMQIEPADVHVVDVASGEALPAPEQLHGVVVTGSSAMVSHNEAWSVSTGRWLARARAAETPILGICYGHQLLAQALGGEVGPNPRGRQIGTVAVRLTDEAARDPLFEGLPRTIRMHTTHVEVALRLPRGAELLARTPRDPLHAFRLGDACWGVQFHPEFDADVLRGYIDTRREALQAEGLDPEALSREASDTPHGALILRRFAEYCESRAGGRRIDATARA